MVTLPFVRIAFAMLLSLLTLAASDEPLVIRNVTLIDVRATDVPSARQEGMSVVLTGETITAIGPAAELSLPTGARVIDGSGKFLIPGLFDMHVHLSDLGPGAMTSLVVHGVTSVRDLGGDLEVLNSLSSRLEAQGLVGPRLARAGFVLESQEALEGMLALYDEGNAHGQLLRRTRLGIADEDDARKALERVLDSGADLLKIRTSPAPELYRWLVREARRSGLRVVSHEPSSIDLVEAARLGVGSIEHLPLRNLHSGLPSERRHAIHTAMVEHGMHATPTIQAMRVIGLGSAELARALEDERAGPRWRTLSPELIEKWEGEVSLRVESLDASAWNALRKRGEAALRGMHEAGVPMLAGTDLGLALLYPGLSLHDELVALVDRIGLTPLEALQSATTNGASWLGWEQLGSIRVGNLADLVLLDAAPLQDISNVGRIHAVFRGGVDLGPRERDRLLAALAAAQR